MDNTINKIGNIIFYTFNLITAPILIIWGLCILFDKYDLLVVDGTTNGYFMFVMFVCLAIVWRIQYLLSAIFRHDNKFGLDFYKYKKYYVAQSNPRTNINQNVEPSGLFKLFEKYCLDETIDIRHKKTKVNDRNFDICKLTQIDTGCLLGYNSSFIGQTGQWDIEHCKGYKITLDENPPLYLFPIDSRFYIKFPKFWCNKNFENKYISDVESLNKNNNIIAFYKQHDDLNGIKHYEVNIHEYAISMGDIIEFISREQYLDLLKLHSKAESNYSKYMLNKRLEEK